MVTPMLIVMFAIGSTDLLFALDSIPAILAAPRSRSWSSPRTPSRSWACGSCTFLLGSLLTELVYLSYGLAVVILDSSASSSKLEALHENNLPFLNDGQPVPVPTVGIALSLSIIVGVPAITTVASLVKSRRDASAGGPWPPLSHLARRRGLSEALAATPGRVVPPVRRAPRVRSPDPSRP